MTEEFDAGILRAGPVTVKTKIPKKLQGKAIQEIARKHYKVAQEKTLRYGKDTLQVEIRNSNKVASGKLLNSVSSQYVEGRKGTAFNFESKIYFKEPGGSYAGFANEGRGPDKNPPNPVGQRSSNVFRGISPMVQAISDWMEDKGIDKKYLFYIVRNIKFFGTKKNKGNGFIQRTQKRIAAKALENAREAREAIALELNK